MLSEETHLPLYSTQFLFRTLSGTPELGAIVGATTATPGLGTQTKMTPAYLFRTKRAQGINSLAARRDLLASPKSESLPLGRQATAHRGRRHVRPIRRLNDPRLCDTRHATTVTGVAGHVQRPARG
ncbi:MAG TPA: hypothetical protein VD767_06000 [Thermomicrobiales bacterium]|nr:hypothetical protein [Thermomicrobiales bacterium]